MQLNDPTLKIITTQNVTTNTLLHSPEGKEYISTFSDMIKCSQTLRIYITDKIESSRSIANLKYGHKNGISNIFDTPVTNSAFLTHKQFDSHKEHSIGSSALVLLFAILFAKLFKTY